MRVQPMSVMDSLSLHGGKWLAHPRGEVNRPYPGWVEWSRVMGGTEYRFRITPPVDMGADLFLPGEVTVLTWSRARGCWSERVLWTF